MAHYISPPGQGVSLDRCAFIYVFHSLISTIIIEHFFMLGTLIDTGDKILSNTYDTISVPVMQRSHETWKVYIWLLDLCHGGDFGPVVCGPWRIHNFLFEKL